MRRVALRARLLRPFYSRKFYDFGPHSILHKPDWVYGPHLVSVGDSVVMMNGLWLSVERQAWGKPGPVVRIGNRVGIRPYCTITAAESITIEDDVMIGSFTTILDNDHTYEGGMNILYNRLEVTPTRIGRGTWVGERVAILRGANIGETCVIGANSVVRGTIPDYSIAVGAPAKVVGSVKDRLPEGLERS